MSMRYLASVLVLGGSILILAASFLVWQRLYPHRVLASNKAHTGVVTASEPIRLVVPSVGIDASVSPSKIDNGQWQVSDYDVSYLTSSARLGQRGNSVFYGHDFVSILGRLGQAKIGAEVDVQLKNGRTLKYRIAHMAVVEPSEVQVIGSTADERLTIYTCTGFLDGKRLVVTARPEKLSRGADSREK